MGRTFPRLGTGVLLGLLFLGPTPVQAADAWLGRDKALHFGVSALMPTAGYVAGSTLFDKGDEGLLLGMALGIGVGAGKELYDLTGRGDPSWRDFGADVMGIVTGATFSWAMDRLFLAPARRVRLAQRAHAASYEEARLRDFQRALEVQLQRTQRELKVHAAPQ